MWLLDRIRGTQPIDYAPSILSVLRYKKKLNWTKTRFTQELVTADNKSVTEGVILWSDIELPNLDTLTFKFDRSDTRRYSLRRRQVINVNGINMYLNTGRGEQVWEHYETNRMRFDELNIISECIHLRYSWYDTIGWHLNGISHPAGFFSAKENKELESPLNILFFDIKGGYEKSVEKLSGMKFLDAIGA